jgi:hypothetical protein
MSAKKEPSPPTELMTIETPTTIELSSQRFVTPSVLDMFDRIAPMMARSRMMGVLQTEQAYAIMLKGYEIGLSITASFEFVQSVAGKSPQLSPRGAMALLHSSPLMEPVIIKRLTDDKGTFIGYECTMTRKTGFTHTSRFTLADAATAGLIKDGGGWVTYPENMCMWRAIGFCADVVAPDITAGMTAIMKMPEQFGMAIGNSGEIIDVRSVPVQSGPTLNDLIEKYGAEKILEVCGTNLPTTAEEINAVMNKLSEVSQ